ncbi:hypothetical protein JCM1841_004016 [Sporobolomyces salmonicolor]
MPALHLPFKRLRSHAPLWASSSSAVPPPSLSPTPSQRDERSSLPSSPPAICLRSTPSKIGYAELGGDSSVQALAEVAALEVVWWTVEEEDGAELGSWEWVEVGIACEPELGLRKYTTRLEKPVELESSFLASLFLPRPDLVAPSPPVSLTLPKPSYRYRRVPSRSRSRSSSRDRTRSPPIRNSPVSTSSSAQTNPSRRHSSASMSSFSNKSAPASSSASTASSSLSFKISTCLDSAGRRVLTSRRRHSDVPTLHRCTRKKEVFGVGDDEVEDPVLEWCETLKEESSTSVESPIEKADSDDELKCCSTPEDLSSAGLGMGGIVFDDGDEANAITETLVREEGSHTDSNEFSPLPPASLTIPPPAIPHRSRGHRPALQSLIIPPSGSLPEPPLSSPTYTNSLSNSPTPSPTASLTMRNPPQPIKTFTPPPPLYTPTSPTKSTFSSLTRAYSSPYSSSSPRRRSSILYRSSNKGITKRMLRSSASYGPPMAASPPRGRPVSCVLPTPAPVLPALSLSPPLTPGTSIETSSGGCSTDLLLGRCSSTTSSGGGHQQARRASVVSFDLPPSPALSPSTEAGRGRLSSEEGHLRSRSAPSLPGALDRYRHRHQRSASDGMAVPTGGQPFAWEDSSGWFTVDDTLEREIGLGKLTVANPDLPPLPLKSARRPSKLSAPSHSKHVPTLASIQQMSIAC